MKTQLFLALDQNDKKLMTHKYDLIHSEMVKVNAR